MVTMIHCEHWMGPIKTHRGRHILMRMRQMDIVVNIHNKALPAVLVRILFFIITFLFLFVSFWQIAQSCRLLQLLILGYFDSSLYTILVVTNLNL